MACKIQLSDPPPAKVNHRARRNEEQGEDSDNEHMRVMRPGNGNASRIQAEMVKMGVTVTHPSNVMAKEMRMKRYRLVGLTQVLNQVR